MLSNLLVLLFASSGLAMPQPASDVTPQLHQRQFQIVNQECVRNCTWGCKDDVCPMLCTIKCRKPKRAYIAGESKEFGMVRREAKDEEDEGDEDQEFAVVDMSWKW